MSDGDELYVWQEYVNGHGWGAIGGYVPAVKMTTVFQHRKERVARTMFEALAREHARERGNRLRLARFQLVSAQEVT